LWRKKIGKIRPVGVTANRTGIGWGQKICGGSQNNCDKVIEMGEKVNLTTSVGGSADTRNCKIWQFVLADGEEIVVRLNTKTVGAPG